MSSLPRGQVLHSPDVLKRKGLRLLGKGRKELCLGGLKHKVEPGLQASLQLVLVFPESSFGPEVTQS